jgi:hypothetical protein
MEQLTSWSAGETVLVRGIRIEVSFFNCNLNEIDCKGEKGEEDAHDLVYLLRMVHTRML